MRFLSLALPVGVALTASVAFAQAAPSDSEQDRHDSGTMQGHEGMSPESEDMTPESTSPEYSAPDKTQPGAQQEAAPVIREREVERERVIQQGKEEASEESEKAAEKAAEKADKEREKAEAELEKEADEDKAAYTGGAATTEKREKSKWGFFGGSPGFTLSAGGGVIGFSEEETRDVTSTGGAYQARLGIGTRTPIAIEVAYIGSANNIDTLGLDTSTVLLGNGVEGTARINFMSGMFRPYVVGGAGWKHYSLVNDDFNTSAISDSDDVAEFPVGAGISFHYGKFLMDARGSYRFTANSDLLDALPDSPNLNNWDATLRAGVEF